MVPIPKQIWDMHSLLYSNTNLDYLGSGELPLPQPDSEIFGAKHQINQIFLGRIFQEFAECTSTHLIYMIYPLVPSISNEETFQTH